jgi:nicotinamidase-related amidase
MKNKRILVVVDYQNDFTEDALRNTLAMEFDNKLAERVKCCGAMQRLHAIKTGLIKEEGNELADLMRLKEEYEKAGFRGQDDEENEALWVFQDTHNADTYFETLEGKKLPILHTVEGTKGWEIFGRTGEAIKKVLEQAKDISPAFNLKLGEGAPAVREDGIICRQIRKESFGSKNVQFAVNEIKAVRNKQVAKSYGMKETAPSDLMVESGLVFEICGVITNMCVIAQAILIQTYCPNAQIIINGGLCASNDPTLHDKALEVMESMFMTIKR